jgi:hypothetical protein
MMHQDTIEPVLYFLWVFWLSFVLLAGAVGFVGLLWANWRGVK